MRLEHFNYIIEIARYKSMSKASKQLFITQPSLSTAIQSLEEELGFQIFKRSSSGVTLTDKGEAMLDISKNIMAEMEKIQILSDLDADTVSHIRLAAVPVFCNAIIFELIATLERKYPHIDLDILELRPKKILPALIEGRADIVMGSYYPSNREEIFHMAAEHNLAIETLFEDKMYVFVHRNHPVAQQKVAYSTDFINDVPAFFNDRDFMASYADLAHGNNPPEFDPERKTYCFTDRASIQKAIAKGLAFAILPHMMVYDDLYVNSGMIIPVPMADANVRITTYVAYLKDKPLPSAYRQLIDTTKSLCEDIQSKIQVQEPTVDKEISDINNSFITY